PANPPTQGDGRMRQSLQPPLPHLWFHISLQIVREGSAHLQLLEHLQPVLYPAPSRCTEEVGRRYAVFFELICLLGYFLGQKNVQQLAIGERNLGEQRSQRTLSPQLDRMSLGSRRKMWVKGGKVGQELGELLPQPGHPKLPGLFRRRGLSVHP